MHLLFEERERDRDTLKSITCGKSGTEQIVMSKVSNNEITRLLHLRFPQTSSRFTRQGNRADHHQNHHRENDYELKKSSILYIPSMKKIYDLEGDKPNNYWANFHTNHT